MDSETWRAVPGYEGLYEVSDRGRVRSLERKYHVTQSKGEWEQTVPERILKPSIVDKTETLRYCTVTLCKDNTYKSMLIHRIVASAFIPNPCNHPYINHIDCNGENNCVENLEWCTPRWNAEWAVICGHRPYPADAFFEASRTKVYCPELDKEFESIAAAKEELGLHSDYVTASVKNKGRKSKRYYSVQNELTVIAVSDKEDYFNYIEHENSIVRPIFTYGRHAVDLATKRVFYNFHELQDALSISAGTLSTKFYSQYSGYLPKYDCYLVDIGYRTSCPFTDDECHDRMNLMKCMFVRTYAKNVVRCDTTGELYHSAQEAEHQMGLPNGCIRERIAVYDGNYPKLGLHFSHVNATLLSDAECLQLIDKLVLTFNAKRGRRKNIQ